MAIGQRYQAADRIAKKLILDEFTKVTGYHRKHAIRILAAQPTLPQQRPARQRIYREAVKRSFGGAVGGRRSYLRKQLKPLLLQLVEAMERHGHLQLEVEL